MLDQIRDFFSRHQTVANVLVAVAAVVVPALLGYGIYNMNGLVSSKVTQETEGNRAASGGSASSAGNTTQQGNETGLNEPAEFRQPGVTYDIFKSQLLGPVVPRKHVRYNETFPHPTTLFPRSVAVYNDSEQTKAELRELHANLTIKQNSLRKIILEMDQIIAGDSTRIPNLMTLINEAGTAQKFVFVGSQSVGKSHILNVITQLSLSAMNISMGTKAPVHIKMGTVAKGQERFQVDGVSLKFEEILPELQRRFESRSNITETEIEVVVYSPFVAFPLNFVDLPGYVVTRPADAETVIRLVQKYAKDPNVVFVMVADASRDPATEADAVLQALRRTVSENRLMFILNKVNVLLSEGHSATEFLRRIQSIIDYLGCKSSNLPYLFTIPKDETLGESDERLLPEQQVAKWGSLVDKGDEYLKKLEEKFASPNRRFFDAGYPSDRIGVKAWKTNSAKKIIEKFRSTIDSFIFAEERDAPPMASQEIIQVPSWTRVIHDFIHELTSLTERVADARDGIWERVHELGGYEFEESLDELRRRNNQCVDFLLHKYSPIPASLQASEIIGRTLINPIVYAERKTEKGSTMLLREIEEQRLGMLSSLYKPTNDDIDRLIPKDHRTITICDHTVIPALLSSLATKIFSQGTVHRQVLRLECTFRRIIRTGLWLQLEQKNLSDPLQILTQQSKFQEYVHQRFEIYFKQVYERSVWWVAKLIGQIMDASITDRSLRVKKELLQNTFKDLRDKWPEASAVSQCVDLVGRKSVVNFDEFFENLRNLAILHYSDRIMQLSEMITYHFTMEWEELTKRDALDQLRKIFLEPLQVTEEEIAEKFDLSNSLTTATELTAAKGRLVRAIREGTLAIRSRLDAAVNAMNLFDPYKPRLSNDSETPATQEPKKNQASNKSKSETESNTVDSNDEKSEARGKVH